jgi:hypothetical protein
VALRRAGRCETGAAQREARHRPDARRRRAPSAVTTPSSRALSRAYARPGGAAAT